MKKLLLCATAMVLATACVDNNFDVSDVNLDDIGIGNSESEFRLPLANIDVRWSAVNGNTYDSMKNILGEADTWTPSAWTQLDLEKLKDKDKDYLDAVVNGLMDDIKTPGAKRKAVIDVIAGNSEYKDAVIPKNPETGEPLFSVEEYIDDHFDDFADDVNGALRDIIDAHLESLTSSMAEIEQPMDGLDMDDSIIDALAGDGNELEIYGTVENRLPFKVEGQFELAAEEDGTVILTIPLDIDYQRSAQISTTIKAEDLRKMSEQMEMRVLFSPTVYYPRTEVPADYNEDGSDEPTPADLTTAMKMTLKLRKTGGLNISDL